MRVLWRQHHEIGRDPDGGDLMSKPDFLVINHGSIFTLRALSPEAKLWVDDNLGEDFLGAVEPRYIHDIVEGITNDGMVCA